MKFELKDICFFDCETTGVPAKGLKWDADFNQFPHVVQLARIWRNSGFTGLKYAVLP